MSRASPRASGTTTTADRPWHVITLEEVAAKLQTRLDRGLGADEAQRRLARDGPNVLAAAAPPPWWRRVLALLTEPMTLVLFTAAVVSFFVSGEVETPVAILLVVVLNTVLNLLQERRAESSLRALQDLTVPRARVRRDGRLQEVDAANLVAGDVVLLDAGDVVPADGRLVEEAGLEVQESALTGESVPAAKSALPLADSEAALGDRANTVFSSTAVTRGRGSFVVTATGMGTEIGRVARMLAGAGQEATPLQRRIAALAKLLSVIAGIVVTIVIVLGLLRGTPLGEVLLTGVSLAVATIPEGLTAVVAFTLAMGARRLAERGAIVKDLSSVETLGSTAHIATDKTGTLTLNEMTARALFTQQRRFEVSGTGYSTDGQIRVVGEEPAPDVRAALLAMSLCSDAVVENGRLVGDPTEGALVVLAEKGGLDVDAARRQWPRAAEVPFDSARKYLASIHRWAEGTASGAVVSQVAQWAQALHREASADAVMFVKGAPDVVLGRCAWLHAPGGPVPLGEDLRARITAVNSDLGAAGLRVMAVAYGSYPRAAMPLDAAAEAEPEELDPFVADLVLVALVGIVDPPRQEARVAVADSRQAGIRVHMITGDHVGTASAIARDLGIPGEAVSGVDLDRMEDAELARRASGLGVLARVSPDHKIRMVRALSADGSVVAMTGDGVNDAPALKQADIGIAMGITGTEVSKGAARMILTDDNFATIVAAVRQGRGIFDNILKFVRFQIATSWGFVLLFLVAGVFGIAGGAPFTALQILWVNLIMDGPPAMALGLDPPDAEVMRRPPRPTHEGILTRDRIARILLAAAVMAGGTLAVLVLAPGEAPQPGVATEVGTLAFTTYVLFQLFNLLAVRSRDRSVFARVTLTNRVLWGTMLAVLVLQVLAVHLPLLQGVFSTAALDAGQWATAVAVASSILWVEELRKLLGRWRARRAGRRGGSGAVAA